jgi:hypothetical protein
MARKRPASSDKKPPKAATLKLMADREWLDGMLEQSFHRRTDQDRITVPKNNPYERQKKTLLDAHNQRMNRQRINKSTNQ